MRSTSAIAFLAGAMLVTLTTLSAIAMFTESDTLQKSMKDFVDSGQAVIDRYSQQVEEEFQQRLNWLFDELDKNRDGVLQRDEFKGASLAMMAAMRSVSFPQLFDLPTLMHFTEPSAWWKVVEFLRIIFLFDVAFLTLLYVAEHVRCLIFGQPSSMNVGDYKNRFVGKVSISEAMTYDTPVTALEKFKIAFFVLTGMVFVRILFFFIFFALGVFFITLSVFNGRTRKKNPTWFRCCEYGVFLSGSMMLVSVGFSKVVKHGQRDPSCKLIVGNHVNVIEVVYLFISSGLPSFVSRIENLHIPLFRQIVECCNAILVDRDAATSRQKTLAAIKHRAADPTAVPLMIMPEGTCNMQRALFQFRRGAFEAGLPIQMCCTKFPYSNFNPTWCGRAVNGNDLIDLAFRLCCQFVNRVEVAWLPVYTPTKEEVENPTLYAQHVQQMMAAVLQIPASDACYADYVTAQKTYQALKSRSRGSATTSPNPEHGASPGLSPQASPFFKTTDVQKNE